MDERCQRFFVDPDDTAPPLVVGWEVADGAALVALSDHLERAGVAATREHAEFAERRFVQILISFRDPLGNRLEAFCGPREATTPFEPGRAISRFRTGPQRMGHIVLTTADLERDIAFYRDVLEFPVGDYMTVPFSACFFPISMRATIASR